MRPSSSTSASRRADHEWHGDVTSQSDDHSSGSNDFHAQSSEEESGAGEGEAASGQRAARQVACEEAARGATCGGKHVGQHVRGARGNDDARR